MRWMKDWQAWVLMIFFIVAHESGHCAAAKLMNMLVTEFSIGFGPGVTLFSTGETEVTLRLVPLGGYNSIFDSETMALPAGTLPRPYASLRMAAVSSAGLLLQLIMMAVAVYFLYRLSGGQRRHAGYVIEEMADAGPGRNLGLAPGDRLFRVNGKLITSAAEMTKELKQTGSAATLAFQHGARALDLEVSGIAAGGFSVLKPDGGICCSSRSFPDIDTIAEALQFSGRWIELPSSLPLRQRIHGFAKFQVATFMGFFGSVCPTEFPEMNPFEGQKRELLWDTLRWSFEANMFLVIFNVLPQPFSDGEKIIRHLGLALVPGLSQSGQYALQVLLALALAGAFAGMAQFADRFIGLKPAPKGQPLHVVPR